MELSTQDLLEDLERLETELDTFPSANDIRRDGKYSLNPYYNRFGWSWSDVEDAYNTWRSSGELPEQKPKIDARSFR